MPNEQISPWYCLTEHTHFFQLVLELDVDKNSFVLAFHAQNFLTSLLLSSSCVFSLISWLSFLFVDQISRDVERAVGLDGLIISGPTLSMVNFPLTKTELFAPFMLQLGAGIMSLPLLIFFTDRGQNPHIGKNQLLNNLMLIWWNCEPRSCHLVKWLQNC